MKKFTIESLEVKKSRATKIFQILKKTYPNAHCELNFKSPLQLLVATILAAQCTDKRVNLVTPQLFKKYKTSKDFAKADTTELENLIKSTGFYKNKAKSIKNMAAVVEDKFSGRIPKTMEELIKLPGVGRKTANVILGNAYGLPGITVDTHFTRLSNRFGWTKEKDPVKIEFEIQKLFKDKYWTDLSQLVVWHGRRRCHARKPACGVCPLSKLCPSFGEGPTNLEVASKLVKPDSYFK